MADPIYGITIDTIDDIPIAGQITRLETITQRLTARVVFDTDQAASFYTSALTALSPNADIMGELMDSDDVASVSPTAYTARATSYLSTLGSLVDIWEVGNEVNGNWLGDPAVVAAKVLGAFNVFHGAGKTTALTVYYNPNGVDGSEPTPQEWLDTYCDSTVKNGLDYVLISYYEVDFEDYRPDEATITALCEDLRARCPNAQIGFGEVGLDDAVASGTLGQAQDIMAYYYGLNIALSYYIAGCFWWYGSEDILQGASPDMISDFQDALDSVPGGGVSPSIDSLTPSNGDIAGGDSIVIAGSNFTGATSVTFGGSSASFSVDDDSQITATTPAHAAGSVSVVVTTPDGTDSSSFTYDSGGPPPVINTITPATGDRGTIVTIDGTDFDGADVTFDGDESPSLIVTSEEITAEAPAHAVGSVELVVTTDFGSDSTSFTYTGEAAYPAAVIADNPTAYWRLGEVAFDLDGTTAADDSGNGHDGTYHGGVTSSAGLLDADGNDAATFDGTADDQYVKSNDDFGNTTYPSFTLECWATFTSDGNFPTLVGVIDATYGHWVVMYQKPNISGDPVVALNWGGVSLSTNDAVDVVVPIGQIAHLVITYDGTTVASYLDGALYDSSPVDSDAVDFNSVSAHLYVGGDDLANDDGSFARLDEVAFYEYALDADAIANHYAIGTGAALTPPPGPVVDSLTPSSGASAGATSVVIAGSNFTGTTSVTFGGIAASSFMVDSDSQITAASPPHAAGSVSVVVTTVDGSDSGVFAYTGGGGGGSTLMVSSVNPTSGLVDGNTSVTISGSGFIGTTSVKFGGVAASFSVNNDNQIVARTPAHATGATGVVVSTLMNASTDDVVFTFVDSIAPGCDNPQFVVSTLLRARLQLTP